MKKIISHSIIACLSLYININTSKANHIAKDSQDVVCLEVIGIAVGSDKLPINGVQVKLYKENIEFEWIEITNVLYHEHSFDFMLNANEYYTIEISKPGYITRSIAISTNLPSSISLNEIFHYEFEVELFKEKKAVDDYYLDFPVALINYNAKRDVFDNNYAYTAHIKQRIKESFGEIRTKGNKK